MLLARDAIGALVGDSIRNVKSLLTVTTREMGVGMEEAPIGIRALAIGSSDDTDVIDDSMMTMISVGAVAIDDSMTTMIFVAYHDATGVSADSIATDNFADVDDSN